MPPKPSVQDLRTAIGHNIRTARIQHKMTLRKLSRLSGVSEGLLDQYELGEEPG